MSPAQKRSYENGYPLFAQKGDSPGFINKGELFGNNNPLIIEIGFGMGTATAIIAEQNQEINYLGIDVHRPGIGRLLWEIENRNLKNVRIVEGDAVEIIEQKIISILFNKQIIQNFE